MKTYKTERHNIPEGATHYRNECVDRKFMWIKAVKGSFEIVVDSSDFMQASWLTDDKFSSSIKPIPQTKEVEWVNGLPPVGAECVFTPHNMQWGFNHIEDFTGTVLHYEGEQFVFMLNHTKYKLEGDMVVVSRTDKGDFSKPESPEDREKREELEAAKRLYCVYMSKWNFKQDWDVLDSLNKSAFVELARETEYRKGGE